MWAELMVKIQIIVKNKILESKNSFPKVSLVDENFGFLQHLQTFT